MLTETVFITEEGVLLQKQGERMLVRRQGEVVSEFQLRMLRNLLVFGHAQMTTQLVHALLSSGVDVSFLSRGGRLKGRLVSAESKNVYARLAQYARWHDEGYRLRTARAIVQGKLAGILGMLGEVRSDTMSEELRQARHRIEELKDSVLDCYGVNNIMGKEGIASAIYFQVFKSLLRQDLGFVTRQKHPSPDPVNALLSLGYMILTNELSSQIEANSLDPHIGFLHGIKYGRCSLALDMVEEFRQQVVDRLVLRAVNLRIFKESDFQPGEDGGCYLTNDGLKRYLSLYEETMRGTNDCRTQLQQNVQRMRHSLLEGSIYLPSTLSEGEER